MVFRRRGGRRVFRRTRRVRFTRRYKGKRRLRSTYKTAIIKSPTFARDLYVKLKYNMRTNMIGGSGVIPSYVFRGNDIYDPDFTGTGGQPLGFDQYITIYNKWTVMGSKCKVNFSNHSGDGAMVSIQGNTSNSWSNLDWLNQPLLRSACVGPSTGIGTKTLSKYLSTASVMGVTKSKVRDEDSYSGSSSLMPSSQWYWLIKAGAMNPTASVDVDLNCTLTYYVRFYDPKQLNSS